MAFREEIQKKLDRKRAEISALDLQLNLAQEYAKALEDMLKMAPREAETERNPSEMLRSGTALADARQAILSGGKPLHISDILKAIGKPDTKKDRVSLVGSLGTYVRQGKVFTRPRPNVFGLVEMNGPKNDTVESTVSESEDGTALRVA